MDRRWWSPQRFRRRCCGVVVQVRRANKFGAVATFVDGVRFDSKIEARRWEDLRIMECAGEISNLRRQVRFALDVGMTTIGHYVADFVYHRKDGQRIIEDVKGHQTEIFKRSAKHMAAQDSPITIWPPVPVKTRNRRVKT